MKSISPRSRALLSRTLAALLGGYALTCACVIFLGAVLPLPKSQAILAASLTSFAVYTAVIVWAFATPNLKRIWLVLLIASLVLTGAGILLGGEA
ncbi:hypothetical protein [Pseudomonas sp. ML96]|uniref:hypothetical protein n=1 Tax=Pseudomonas sp. ML96 TaxID=1523503 RepID=UPI0005B925EC|nr:hypothetical protein [Pseudomonas sp. ML96]